MIRNGEAYVPPTCPTPAIGDRQSVNPTDFRLYVDDNDRDGQSTVIAYSDIDNESLSEVYGLTCAVIVEAADTDFSRSAKVIEVRGEQAYREVGDILTDNIRNCHGIVDGECHALGSRACRAAILAVGSDAIQ